MLAADGCASTSSGPGVLLPRRLGPRRAEGSGGRHVRVLTGLGMLICRNEYFNSTHIYARTGILTHNFLDLAGEHRAVFSIVLVGNQIADSARVTSQLIYCFRAAICASSGRPEAPLSQHL